MKMVVHFPASQFVSFPMFFQGLLLAEIVDNLDDSWGEPFSMEKNFRLPHSMAETKTRQKILSMIYTGCFSERGSENFMVYEIIANTAG